jgi:hypothetical protein
MTVARQLAAFLIATRTTDLPELALDHPAMVVASTLASAACGTGIESARIIRAIAQERTGEGMRRSGSMREKNCPSPARSRSTRC